MPKKQDYQSLSVELDGVLAALQAPDLQVDQAITLYEKGLQLIAELEAYLTEAENKIEKIKLKAVASQKDT